MVFLAFGGLILMVVFGAIKSSDAYKTAVARASADPRVVNALGTPIKEGMLVSGSIKTSGPSGNADLSIPISGPKGKGTIYAVATKSAGQWRYSTLTVEVAGTGERIELNRQ